MLPLYILKLGGSVITAKREGKPVIKKEEIIRIAKEIMNAQKKDPFGLILIHGAGSFGHGLAKKYKLWEGLTRNSQILAFSKTQAQTVFLNHTVLDVFASLGLPVVAINPTSIIIQKDKKLVTFSKEAIVHFLERGFIPVLYGTVVADTKLSGSICSGDTMLTHLAKELKARRAIFATDVDGVFTQDPNRFEHASLIAEITDENYKEVIKGSQGSASKIDVGGGMRGKLEEIHQSLKKVEVLIVNGSKKGSIQKALVGEKLKGTKILFS
ncbi:hypothetical protein A2962_01195 [Candidatus Woesebacteria bacterium RIFCSPLOWO2_01_FULL_39_61]|uniref:Isopentenyl phosphate kinase n=1 Tax=Candidatus Woesebacteria bacterium RIFCSPHIGHO2_02_FULL_39_13 TaxID=1802505 RepID=A0A1F7Z3K6_9BACT|nr:MAG: hypothetical protein A2692_00570 [Candidatus Woesebacteria bacterium RIFCSPHIGHO2_01_FULL_39_95]OGM33355.1 MAG: hypothetical protein A3D01_00505 [Candidatus Woesebacteria bacterium RIFCSPHIGHO2_02_FULL_39_13]OGM36290.1 MAG: hypothetical protein A3E13_03595 [Candidatus Woesebacteria bacterium RIFCSPHIGHO2_12_FULL_40_20]OGM66281.1 MAG: hypothetical protein A2962_01195 [Candidatus Woesebacteria bacterium RIFCSPLOWO2_01_FULL_39_61]